MSRGFRGTQEAINNGAYHLAQQAPAKTLCGVGVDYNSVNPDKADFGSFVVSYEETSSQPTGGVKRYQVISRSRLMLREGPGTNFNVVGSLQPGQRVAATPHNEQWSSVDVEGDGLIDGFAASAYLKEIV